MAPTMKGTPVARYGSLPRLPWASPTFDDMNMTPVHPIRDPSYMDLPAGVATELYRGPRYEKQPMHVEAASAEWATVYQKPHVPTRGERIRANRAATTAAMEWKAEAGGWVQKPSKEWVNRPTPNGEAVWTNWGVDRGWERPRTAPNLNIGGTPKYPKPAEKPTGVAAALAILKEPYGASPDARKVNAKYADGISRPPWMAPLPDYMLAQPETPESSKAMFKGPDVYEVPMAPGTNVAVRGGSWPVKMTVPPDGSPTSVMH